MPACPYCAEPIAPRLRVCPHCDSDLLNPPRRPARHNAGDDAGMRLLLPVGRSGWAIAAGYLGLISLVLIPAPLAVIFSIIAIRHLQKNPDLHGMGRAVFGLVMGVLGSIILVIAIIAIAANAPQKRRFGQATVRTSVASTGVSAAGTIRSRQMPDSPIHTWFRDLGFSRGRSDCNQDHGTRRCRTALFTSCITSPGCWSS